MEITTNQKQYLTELVDDTKKQDEFLKKTNLGTALNLHWWLANLDEYINEDYERLSENDEVEKAQIFAFESALHDYLFEKYVGEFLTADDIAALSKEEASEWIGFYKNTTGVMIRNALVEMGCETIPMTSAINIRKSPALAAEIEQFMHTYFESHPVVLNR